LAGTHGWREPALSQNGVAISNHIESQPCLYKTGLSANPALSASAFLGGKTSSPQLLDVSKPLITTSGRMAIALVIEKEGIGPGDEVLIPGYHCNSMVTPIVNVGGIPVFYKILPNMDADLADIRSKLSDKTKGILVTHYFGFTQPLAVLRSLCDAHNLILIEDCAHAFFGQVNDRPVGSYGDYAIGSLMKFFPVFDGGCLVSSRHNLPPEILISGGRSFELQSMLNTLEISFTQNKLALLKWLLILPLALKTRIWNWIKVNRRNKGQTTRTAPAASCGGIDFDPRWIHVRGSLSTRLLLRCLSTNRIIQRRKDNYAYLSRRFSGSRMYQPLFQNLPEETVPYVFPLLVSTPDPYYYSLRSGGLPLLRWEQLWEGAEESNCETSNYYSRHLIQIPCHQEFTQTDLEYMASTIIDAFGETDTIQQST
jgi:dTDP-4-amino-4,6-dideoxygalactose transaminase